MIGAFIKNLSIKTKFTVIALLISLISFGVAAFISNLWVLNDFQKDYEEKAMLIGAHFLHELEEAMIFRKHEEMTNALDFYRNYKEVKELRIFNSKGKEVFTHEQGSPEAGLGEALRTGKTIRFRKEINKQGVTSFVIPIKNKPECQGCHGKDEALRGALLLSLSLEEMERYIGQQRKRFLMLFGLIAVVIGAMTLVAVNRLLVRRLRSIQRGAEAIERGDFGFHIPGESVDEIGSLTTYVNRMAQKLQTFFGDLEDKNRQLTEQFMLISRSHKEWQETFDRITDSIAVIDHQHRLIRANRALKETFREYFSETEHEVIDPNWSEHFLDEILFPGMNSTLLQDRGSTTQEIHHQATGRVFEVSIFPYYSPEGNFAGSVVILKDITKKKEDEMRLILNERLAALGQMASGIAHELNTPLATIAACNEGLLNRVKRENIGSLQFRSYLTIIEEEIERCKKITTGMLSFMKRSNHEKWEIDVNEVLDKTMDMIGFQGRLEDVEISSNLRRRIPKTLGNDGELMQVFLSIIVNALDAMGDRGTLTLETGTEGKTVFIRINDTGPGIPSHMTSRIFDPFFTTKSENGGTGLGLSIANKIVNDHKGKIVVTSIEGKGTTFEVVLPAIQ